MITRRKFMGTSAAAAMAAAAGQWSTLSADEKKSAAPEYPWIDAHSHVWSPDTARWPLANGKSKADLDPPSFTPEELLAIAHPVGVGRAVLIQHHTYHGWDNTYLTDCAATYPGTFVVVGMIDDQAPGAAAKMDDLLKKRVRGFRITPWINKDKWLSSDGMAAMWKKAAETGQAMCCLIDAEDLGAVDAMCARHPQTKVVIDHFARIGVDGTIRDEDVAALCKLARNKLASVKISAYYALGKKKPPYLDLVPMIRKVLDAYGLERSMWASDSPYQVQGEHTYKASIELVQGLDFLSAGDREWLLRKTAERVYFA
jgi:predicted TIM-barrel fold metal-dependent hydrolase